MPPHNRQQNQMGNISKDSQEVHHKDRDIVDRLEFYEQRVSEQFGRFCIMKLNEKPVRYYMRYRETAINDQRTRMRLQQKLAWYCELKQHKNIVSIEYADLQPSFDMCIQKLHLDIYAKYYNYTLHMAIDSKIKRLKRFREGDLVYILFALLSVGRTYESILSNQFCGWFNLNNVYMTPEGFVKVYPFPLNCDIRQGQRNSQSPKKSNKSYQQSEEIVLNLSRKTTDSFNTVLSASRKITDKDDLRDIGLLIFQLLILNKEKIEVQLYSNEKISNILSLLQKEGQISTSLKQILIHLLINSKQAKYHETMMGIADKIDEKSLACSNTIKLQQGQAATHLQFSQKQQNLKQLSQHKNLKVGCISVISNNKKSKV